MRQAKILFFVMGCAPTAKDLEAATKLSAQVCFRNAKAVSIDETCLEGCDGVAGAVPANYKKTYPEAAEAIEKINASINKLTAAAEDEKPPKPTHDAAALEIADGLAKKLEKSKKEKTETTGADWKPNA